MLHEDLIPKYGELSLWLGLIEELGAVTAAIFEKVMAQFAKRGIQGGGYHGQVGFPHMAFLEATGPIGSPLRRFRKKEDSANRPIQSMDEVQGLFSLGSGPRKGI
jgi:hypothetical protein